MVQCDIKSPEAIDIRRGSGKGKSSIDDFIGAILVQPALSPDIRPALRGRRPSGGRSGREALLAAAVACFARHGYQGCSLRLVASEAGVDMALVARLFGSKGALWAAMVDRLAENQAKHLAVLAGLARVAETDPAGAMRRYIILAAEMSAEVPQFLAFLMQEANSPGERLDVIRTRLLEPFEAASRPIIAAAQAAGAIRAEDPELFASMLLAAISLPMACAPLSPGCPKAGAERRDRIAREAIALFVRPAADRQAPSSPDTPRSPARQESDHR